jgi:GNAT superfamily N-acetyltransferase
MTGFDVVTYEPQWLEQVLDLWALVQGQKMSREQFAWQFDRNPTGIVNIHLAVCGDRVIGVVSHSAVRMNVAGREETVSISINTDTHPDFRGRGVFSTLTRAAEDHAREAGAGLALGIPNDESKPIFLGRLGWRSLPGPRVLLRMLAPLSFATQYLGGRLHGGLGIGSRRAVAAHVAVVDGVGMPATTALSLERIHSFGSWADDLWNVVRPTMPHAVMRSASYLNWRFAEKPNGNYACFAARTDSTIVGYIVTGQTVKRNTVISYVAHSLLHPAHATDYSRVRARALSATRHGSVAALDLAYPGTALRMQGRFLPTPKCLNLIYRPLRSDVNCSLIEAEPWHLELGDLDFF